MEIKLPTGEVLHENRFVYTFMHGVKLKHFGPYENIEEAQTAFQQRYGYWPGPCEHIEGYVNDPRDKKEN